MATADAVQTKAEADTPPQGERVRTRTIVIALIFAFVSVIWAREAELVAFACQITESVPPMTALGALLFFVVLSIVFRNIAAGAGKDTAIGRVFGWLSLSGQQSMYIYAFITIATIIFSVGVMRTLLPELTTLTYFADYSNDYAEALPHANQYLHVTDADAVRQLYEGSDEALTGRGPGEGLAGFIYGPIWRTTLVPWGAWITPVIAWSIFIIVLFGTKQCIAALAEREWTLSERLPYPLVEIPLGITEQRSFIATVSFLKDPVMWTGFIVGASYGIHEMIAATTFAFPLLGREHALGNLLTEHPWSAIGGNINIFLMPEAYGLAYFAPQDVLLTTTLSWLGINLFRVGTAAAGYDVKATAYRDATAGSFVGLVLAALWVAKQPIIEGVRRATTGSTREGDELPGEHVWLMRGALAGLAMATKYSAVAVAAPLVAAALLTDLPDIRGRLRLLGAVSMAGIVTFIVACPGWVLAPGAYWEGFAFERTHMALGHLGYFGVPMLGQFELLLTADPVLLVLGLAGLALWGLRGGDRRLLILVVAVLAVLMMAAPAKKQSIQYIFALFPALAVFLAGGVHQLAANTRRRVIWLVTVLLLANALCGLFWGYRRALLPDSTRLARQWINAHIPDENRVAIDWAYVPRLVSRETVDKLREGIRTDMVRGAYAGLRTFPMVRMGVQEETGYSRRFLRSTTAMWFVTSSGCSERFFEQGRFTRLPPPADSELRAEYEQRRDFYRALREGYAGWRLAHEVHTGNGPRVQIYHRPAG
ncbi:MAG: DUF6785 family protein [Armatimonadota bacterium]